MSMSDFEARLKSNLQLHEALAQGRLRVHDRELHVRLLLSPHHKIGWALTV